MKIRSMLRHMVRLIKLVVIGSIVATRSTTGAPASDATHEHELAWMAVREALARSSAGNQLPADVERMVTERVGTDLELSVRASYRNVPTDRIAELDALWMDSLIRSGAGSAATDAFLAERAQVLSQILSANGDGPKSIDEWRNIERIFKRTPYDA